MTVKGVAGTWPWITRAGQKTGQFLDCHAKHAYYTCCLPYLHLSGIWSYLELVKCLESHMENRRPVHFGEITDQEVPRLLDGLSQRVELQGLGLLDLGDQATALVLLVMAGVSLHLEGVCLQRRMHHT